MQAGHGVGSTAHRGVDKLTDISVSCAGSSGWRGRTPRTSAQRLAGGRINLLINKDLVAEYKRYLPRMLDTSK